MPWATAFQNRTNECQPHCPSLESQIHTGGTEAQRGLVTCPEVSGGARVWTQAIWLHTVTSYLLYDRESVTVKYIF